MKPAPVDVTRTQPVRITIDLAPDLHAKVKDWTREVAFTHGRDVALAEVVRGLFRRLLGDPALAAAVRAELAGGAVQQCDSVPPLTLEQRSHLWELLTPIREALEPDRTVEER